mmetsp:Transcript_15869/g.43451  ORF Transcript_15869/g.43451 Transcript_15869/m.43451 type:complete len:516 (+) Transcript_15869:94-1641(+)
MCRLAALVSIQLATSCATAVAPPPVYDHFAYFRLGLSLEESGDLTRAKAAYLRAARLDPAHLRIHQYLSAFLVETGDLSTAAEVSRHVVKLDPSSSTSYVALGRVLERLPGLHGNLDDAKRAYEKATVLDPGDADAHLSLGEMLEKAGDLDGAKVSYLRVIELNSSSAAAHVNLGVVFMQEGSLADAEFCFRKGIHLNPESDVAYANLASTLSLRGDVEGAKAMVPTRIQLAEEIGTWPLRLSLPQLGSNAEVASKLAEEARLVESYVAAFSAEPLLDMDVRIKDLYNALHSRPPLGLRELPAALHRVRCLENSTDWTQRRWYEALEMGEDCLACSYGTTWFDTWVAVMSDKALLAALPNYIDSGLEFVVGGSAIGYQCFFATLGLGLRSTGYELLSGLVEDSERLVAAMKLDSSPIAFVKADATSADLSRTGVLWLNDAVWPIEVRQKMLEHAMETMPAGSTVISYRPLPVADLFPRLCHERIVTASVSWRPNQRFFLRTVVAEDTEQATHVDL